MSPETGSLLLLLFCAGATALIPLTEALAPSGILVSRVKPGKCPADVNFPVGGFMLVNECKGDRNCEGKRKCCFSGGRRQCLLPLDVKNNACPYLDDSVCITKKFAPLCQSDEQCQGTDRCCYYECRFQCTPTVKVKPGTCPPSIAKCAYPPPKPKCKSDGECLGEKKCCTPKCGRECTDPLP